MSKFIGGLAIVDAKKVEGYNIVEMAKAACKAEGMLIVRNSDYMEGYNMVGAMKAGGKHIMLIPEGTDFYITESGGIIKR